MTRRVIGIPCAGCGMTRALAALVRGRWSEALALHPLSVVFVIEAVAAWLAWGAHNAGLVRRPSTRAITLALIVNGAALVIVWIMRLISGTLPG